VSDNAQIANRIKEVRSSLGWSQQKAADAIGVRREMWAKYEAGAEPGAKAIAGMITAGLDIAYILTGQRSQLQVAETPAVYGSELKPDEAALLDNYRHSGKEGQTAIAQVALVAASAQPGTVKSRKKAG